MVRQIITDAQLPSNLTVSLGSIDGGSQPLRIRQRLLGPWMEEAQGNGRQMKTPAEAGLRIYSYGFDD